MCRDQNKLTVRVLLEINGKVQRSRADTQSGKSITKLLCKMMSVKESKRQSLCATPAKIAE